MNTTHRRTVAMAPGRLVNDVGMWLLFGVDGDESLRLRIAYT